MNSVLLKIVRRKFPTGIYTKELKILLCGLSNAGKTSILKILDDDIESIPSLGPTMGANIKTYNPMGLMAHVWDLGGQTRYRVKYLDEYVKYFERASVLFYVIDVQAEELFKDSLNYLKEIVESLTKLNLSSIFISILFHKYDPHISGKEIEPKIRNLWEKVQKIVGRFMFSIYKTSMYDSHTIFQAFSEGILHPFTEAQLFTQRIQELAGEFKSPAASMLNDSGYIYASWHAEQIESGNLWIFNREIQELAQFIRNEKGEKCKILPLTENLNHCSIYFPHKDEIIICAFIIPRTVDQAKILTQLQKSEKEFEKLLKVFDDVRFGFSKS